MRIEIHSTAMSIPTAGRDSDASDAPETLATRTAGALSAPLPAPARQRTTATAAQAGRRARHRLCPQADAAELPPAEAERQAAENVLARLAGCETLPAFELQRTLDESVRAACAQLLPATAAGPAAEGQDAQFLAVQRRITGVLEARLQSEGWYLHRPGAGNVRWDKGMPPLLYKKGRSLRHLTLLERDVASGAFGSVSVFVNENGDRLIGKISKGRLRNSDGAPRDVLAEELAAYRKTYAALLWRDDEAARCIRRNMATVFGIATVSNGGTKVRALLMEEVPGPAGGDVFDALHRCWKTGRISSERYWGAVQFIGRRLLDVVEQLGKVGIVHNDIKPANFHVNAETGEPVLIDFGFWCGQNRKPAGRTRHYASPEACLVEPVDERSDAFGVGASVLAGIEAYRHGATVDADGNTWEARHGLGEDQRVFRDPDGSARHQPGFYAVETAYTRFMNALLTPDMKERPTARQAKRMDFLSDSMLDEDAAKEVIKAAIAAAGAERAWPAANQQVPRRIDAQAARYMDRPEPQPARSTLPARADTDARVAEITARSKDLIRASGWVDAWVPVVRDVERLPHPVAGVDTHGRALDHNGLPDERFLSTAAATLSDVVPARAVLKSFADEAEEFLAQVANVLEFDDSYAQALLEIVRQRAFVARRLVAFEAVDFPASMNQSRLERQQVGRIDPERRAALDRRLHALETGRRSPGTPGSSI